MTTLNEYYYMVRYQIRRYYLIGDHMIQCHIYLVPVRAFNKVIFLQYKNFNLTFFLGQRILSEF